MKLNSKMILSMSILCLFLVGCTDDDTDEIHELEGTYKSACIEDDDGQFNIETNTITSDSTSADIQIYGLDSTCQTKEVSLQLNANIDIGTEYTLSDGNDAYPVDISNVTINMAYHTTEMIDYLNNISWCSYSDWELDVYKDIKTCSDITDPDLDVLAVIDNKLYFGDDNGIADGERPIALEATSNLVKQ